MVSHQMSRDFGWIKEVEGVRETLESFLDSLEGILTPKEEQIILQQIQKLQNQKEEKQKTLKEHEEDIVKCAEAFFREYGKYFTDIEKVLIIQACRQHDWGKANLIFQSKVCQDVRDKLLKSEREISQIPHGFLSAVSISYKEFQKLYDGLEKDDFKAFIEESLEHFTTIHPIEYTKEDVDKKFRNIHSITVLPDTLYEENQILFEEGVNLLRTPNINKDIKNIITSKFSSLTLGLTYYRYKDNRLEGIDVATIGSYGDGRKNDYPVTQIHRTSMKYDFDPDTGRGKGLILGEINDEACIL